MNPYLTPESEIMDLSLEITHISYLGSVVSATKKEENNEFPSVFVTEAKACKCISYTAVWFSWLIM